MIVQIKNAKIKTKKNLLKIRTLNSGFKQNENILVNAVEELCLYSLAYDVWLLNDSNLFNL